MSEAKTAYIPPETEKNRVPEEDKSGSKKITSLPALQTQLIILFQDVNEGLDDPYINKMIDLLAWAKPANSCGLSWLLNCFNFSPSIINAKAKNNYLKAWSSCHDALTEFQKNSELETENADLSTMQIPDQKEEKLASKRTALDFLWSGDVLKGETPDFFNIFDPHDSSSLQQLQGYLVKLYQPFIQIENIAKLIADIKTAKSLFAIRDSLAVYSVSTDLEDLTKNYFGAFFLSRNVVAKALTLKPAQIVKNVHLRGLLSGSEHGETILDGIPARPLKESNVFGGNPSQENILQPCQAVVDAVLMPPKIGETKNQFLQFLKDFQRNLIQFKFDGRWLNYDQLVKQEKLVKLDINSEQSCNNTLTFLTKKLGIDKDYLEYLCQYLEQVWLIDMRQALRRFIVKGYTYEVKPSDTGCFLRCEINGDSAVIEYFMTDVSLLAMSEMEIFREKLPKCKISWAVTHDRRKIKINEDVITVKYSGRMEIFFDQCVVLEKAYGQIEKQLLLEPADCRSSFDIAQALRKYLVNFLYQFRYKDFPSIQECYKNVMSDLDDNLAKSADFTSMHPFLNALTQAAQQDTEELRMRNEVLAAIKVAQNVLNALTVMNAFKQNLKTAIKESAITAKFEIDDLWNINAIWGYLVTFSTGNNSQVNSHLATQLEILVARAEEQLIELEASQFVTLPSLSMPERSVRRLSMPDIDAKKTRSLLSSSSTLSSGEFITAEFKALPKKLQEAFMLQTYESKSVDEESMFKDFFRKGLFFILPDDGVDAVRHPRAESKQSNEIVKQEVLAKIQKHFPEMMYCFPALHQGMTAPILQAITDTNLSAEDFLHVFSNQFFEVYVSRNELDKVEIRYRLDCLVDTIVEPQSSTGLTTVTTKPVLGTVEWVMTCEFVDGEKNAVRTEFAHAHFTGGLCDIIKADKPDYSKMRSRADLIPHDELGEISNSILDELIEKIRDKIASMSATENVDRLNTLVDEVLGNRSKLSVDDFILKFQKVFQSQKEKNLAQLASFFDAADILFNEARNEVFRRAHGRAIENLKKFLIQLCDDYLKDYTEIDPVSPFIEVLKKALQGQSTIKGFCWALDKQGSGICANGGISFFQDMVQNMNSARNFLQQLKINHNRVLFPILSKLPDFNYKDLPIVPEATLTEPKTRRSISEQKQVTDDVDPLALFVKRLSTEELITKESLDKFTSAYKEWLVNRVDKNAFAKFANAYRAIDRQLVIFSRKRMVGTIVLFASLVGLTTIFALAAHGEFATLVSWMQGVFSGISEESAKATFGMMETLTGLGALGIPYSTVKSIYDTGSSMFFHAPMPNKSRLLNKLREAESQQPEQEVFFDSEPAVS